MKHRERVLTALNHDQPDRCPMQVSFTTEFASRLRADLGIPDAATHNPHGGGNTYVLERTLDEDLLLTSVGWANSYYLPFGAPAEVEGEVVTRLKTIGKGGGLIIGSTHHVQLDTPLENFWAMVNTITKTPYGTY